MGSVPPTSRDQADRLYDRSRQAGVQLLTTLLSLATGAVAVLFFGLVGAEKLPVIQDEERRALLAGLVFMTAAVLCGLVGWAADALYYNYWANAVDPDGDPSVRSVRWSRRTSANAIRRWALTFLAGLFFAGVVAWSCYGWMRISAPTSAPTPAPAGGAPA